MFEEIHLKMYLFNKTALITPVVFAKTSNNSAFLVNVNMFCNASIIMP